MKNTEKKTAVKIGGHLKTRMISGLLVLGPLVVTLFILKFIFTVLTAFFMPALESLLILKGMPNGVLVLIATGVALLLIYLVGMFTTHFIGRRLIKTGEGVMMKLPVVKSVYSASKQVMDTFSGSTKAAFTATVLVNFPHAKALAVGFVTGTILNPQGEMLYRVFVATAPNPTAGFLLLLPKEDVTFTNIPVEDGIKMIVSAGMLAPKAYTQQTPLNWVIEAK